MSSFVPFRVKYVLAFLFFLSCFGAISQHVKNYTLADGLPGNSIKCLFKDSKGLLWIATETGLCTFNGSEFNIIGKEHGLAHNLVWAIEEDENNCLWFSLYGNGIAMYDRKKFTYYTAKDGLVHDAVRSIVYHKKQKIVIFGTEDGLSIYDRKKFTNFKVKPKNYTGNFQVNFISNFGDDVFFSVNHGKIYKLKINQRQVEKSVIQAIKNPLNQNYTGLIHRGKYYGRNMQGEFEIQDLQGVQKSTFGKCSNIWDFTIGENNSVYAACWDGNSPDGAIVKYENQKLTDISKEWNLPTSQFWDVYYDLPSKQLWVGTVDKGVFVIDFSKKIQMEKLDFGKNKAEINILFLDKRQNLWIGGNNFIWRKSANNTVQLLAGERFIHYIQSKKKNKRSSTPELGRLYSVIDNQKTVVIQSIKGEDNGNVWVLTNVGLFCLNQELAIIQHIYKHETTGAFDFISSSTIFLSHAYTHSYLVPIQSKDPINTVRFHLKKIGLDAKRIVKSRTKLWIASWTKGLFLYENNRLVSINELDCFSEKNVSDILVDNQQQLVIGTANGRVYFSKWKNNKLIHLKVLNPDVEIIGNSIFFIRKHGDYYLIGTNKGINIIKDYKLFKFINKDENLPQTTYTDACVDKSNKKLLVSTYEGLYSIDLSKLLKPEKLNSPISLQVIKVNGKTVSSGSYLHLNHDQNTIEITFGSTNLYTSKKNYFSYKIVGLTNKWSDFSTENNLKLFNLKSGNYQLLIKGKNIGTNELLEPKTYRIIIRPPFWETWWFRGFLTATIILLLFFSIRQKINKVKNKGKLEKRIAETKLQALQSQMNPHFVFNAMNSIQNFVIDNQIDEALKYIGEFSKLIRQTLHFSSRTRIRLEEEIDFLQRYMELENLRRNNKVNARISAADHLDLSELEIPPMLLQPLIENVFIHAFDSQSKDPKVDIELDGKTDELICKISDNGKGFQKETNTKQSKGIKLVDERIRLLTGSVEKMVQILANPDGGTVIILTIPLR